MDKLLEFKDVRCRFGRTTALDGVSFSVPPGGITALLGPNGAGKSTALRLAVNLLKPRAGEVSVLGKSSRKIGPEELRRIGYVADGMELPLWMTVDRFLAWCRPFYPSWDRDLEARLRADFNLPGDRKLKALSRGQRMKAALLSNLAYRPELLLLDEPFSGLDPIMRDEFIAGLLELAEQENWALVISSHDIEEVQKLADRVVILREGRLILEENVESLLARHRLVELHLAEESTAPFTAAGLPDHWRNPRQSGRILRFVDSAFEESRLAADISRHVPGALRHSVTALPLREVFVHLAGGGKGPA